MCRQVSSTAAYWSSTDLCFSSRISEFPPTARMASFFVVMSILAPIGCSVVEPPERSVRALAVR